MLIEFLVILALILANGVLAGAEIALVTIRRTQIQRLIDRGNATARIVRRLRKDPEAFLATIQIGITVIGATAGAFSGATFAADLAPVISRIPGVGESANEIALAVVIAMVSYLSLLLGELVPKSLALRAAEGYSLVVARPIAGLSWIARPLVWLLTASSNAILRLFGDRTSFIESRVSMEEIRGLVEEASRAGSVDPDAGEIVTRAIDFERLTAREVMIPRVIVSRVPVDITADAFQTLVASQPYQRIPVYESTPENVIGYVSLKDILLQQFASCSFSLRDALRPVHFVPASVRAVELLRDMQRRHRHVACVVDKNGSFTGIVTLEDLVEEVVGEIFSEHESPRGLVHAETQGSYVVSGLAQVREINRELSLSLPDGEGWNTLAGLCYALAGRIPKPGDRLKNEQGIEFEVLEMQGARIKAVRILLPCTGHDPLVRA